MNKKEAEVDAMRKAKDQQHAAGKNSGMSGRDLVRFACSRSLSHLCASRQWLICTQFQFNPEWFEDEDEGDEDLWDLAKYRREQEDADLAAEEERIRALALQDDGGQ